MEYSILKLVHIGALVLWLGPAFGAWVVLKVVENEPVSPLMAEVNKAFFAMITLEHVAFVTLLVTGLIMAISAGWFAAESPWLYQKLWVIGLIIVPLEIVDIILGNWLALQASKSKYEGNPISVRQERWLDIYHGPFTKLAIVLIPISVTLIMYLAVSKVSLI